MLKGDKKGQFYLIAAIIIVAVILGVSTTSNYFKKDVTIELDELSEELGIESAKVLDYGTMNPDQFDAIVEQFTVLFDEYAGEDIEIYFIVGTIDEIEVYRYTSVSGEPEKVSHEDFEIDISNRRVTIIINEVEYSFKIKSGENFYFVIFQQIGEESYVTTNS
ncbi:MAG: hypothetical protein KKF68_00480 [Nanoarchaeota archaeon]|nr:hypothetical protein [Nanoarchaeota archaeon]